ncbi:hypothetical protein, conserved [Plasmodium gonderi]|uniref:Uncharacterized protein n=1 Tax=Plasmodium gonderi TaxID=77519 RepID=A0A1Y1JGP2_PLAGO|nr:hypothetical protein, conserved [Plasmodium gonderi]GAW79932.1 hypothetical protein, conserved [Plasmodium gonderi]
MEDDDVIETLFKRDSESRKRDRCTICKSDYRKAINTFMNWEIVLLLTNLLVFLIIIYKYLRDKKLDTTHKKLFRSYESAGHFMQGLTFVIMTVPFKFTKKIIKFIFNCVMKNDSYMNEAKQIYENVGGIHDIEANKINNYLSNEEDGEIGIKSKGIERNSAVNTTQDNIHENNIEREIANGHCLNPYKHETWGEGNGNEHLVEIGANRNNTCCNGSGNTHKNSSGERSNMNRRRKGGNGSREGFCGIEDNGNISLYESFVNSLGFPANIPKHTKEKVQYFFLCAKLFSQKKSAYLFVFKYVLTFILMFAYPLYNLIKRMIRYNYFHESSYYMNEFDFASGLLGGVIFVFVYGFFRFFINLYMNRKNEKFYFYDNYPFLTEVKCLCDKNIRIIINNNPNLKGLAIRYLNSYCNYKTLLLMGLIILSNVRAFSFLFSLTSLTRSMNTEAQKE